MPDDEASDTKDDTNAIILSAPGGPAQLGTGISREIVPSPPTLVPATAVAPIPTTTNTDVTRSYLLHPSSVRNYDSLVEQLLEDHERPQKTKIHLDVNLNIDLDLSPEVHGELHLSMLCVTVKRKPWEEDVLSSDGRRIAGTVLRISDGQGRLVHRQVVGFESLGEWWWVVRTQLSELIKMKVRRHSEGVRQLARELGTVRIAMILSFPVSLLSVFLWWLFFR